MTQLPDLVRLCDELSDEQLLAALGSALDGSALNVAPLDSDRMRRFAGQWLNTKTAGLWKQIQRTETYRIWAATAGPDQVIEPDVIAATLVQEGAPDQLAAPAAVALHRAEIAKAEPFDIAVSCAERDAGYAGSVVSEARARELHVFFDKELTYAWWGRNFIAEGRRVYGRSALHFVPFISSEYLTEPQPRDAFESAVATSVERGDDYILPVVVGDVRVPPEMLHPHILYLRAEAHSPGEIAAALSVKVAASKARNAAARDIGVMVRGTYHGPQS